VHNRRAKFLRRNKKVYARMNWRKTKHMGIRGVLLIFSKYPKTVAAGMRKEELSIKP